MTWVISIDESGNLGHSSRFFVMSAVIVMRPRHLLNVSKLIPKYKSESKFYNSTDDEICQILKEFNHSSARVVYVVVDKYDHTSSWYGHYGNELYEMVFDKLMGLAFEEVEGSDSNVFLDRSTFLKLQQFRDIVNENASKHNCHVKKCEKVTSQQSKCIQIADYIAGTIYRYSENGDERFIGLIKEKIRCP